MPFFGVDWRSPGEVWIKTDDGWEKQKILECRQYSHSTRSIDNDKENCSVDNHRALPQLQGYVPPYCQITLKCTKEVAGFNGLSDALRRLDFRSAVHDHRRFPYTAKLLQLLLSQHRITNLSGCAQKSVLNVLEEIAVQAQESQQNGEMPVLTKLLSDLRRIVRGDSWWGRPLGSSRLWGQHVQTIDRIDAIAFSIQTTQNGVDGEKTKLDDLPEECVREILMRLADHQDVLNAAEAYDVAHKISAEKRLWKRLCRFHFSPHQINFIIDEMSKERDKNAHREREKNSNSNTNKTNRGSRTLHPYLNNSNNNNNNNNNSNNSNHNSNSNYLSRQNSVRSSRDSITESSHHKAWLLENVGRDDLARGRVSNAFHEHLNRHRDNFKTHQQQEANRADDMHINGSQQQQQQQQQQQKKNQFTSFQDVRNHFDQRNQEEVMNDNSYPRSRNVSFSSRKNDNDVEESSKMSGQTDWEDVYHRLRRLFGLREDYAEILHLCRTCRCLFWKSYGHPCIADQQGTQVDSSPYSTTSESLYVPVPPQAFLKFFSL